jgi:hypothetical protein
VTLTTRRRRSEANIAPAARNATTIHDDCVQTALMAEVSLFNQRREHERDGGYPEDGRSDCTRKSCHPLYPCKNAARPPMKKNVAATAAVVTTAATVCARPSRREAKIAPVAAGPTISSHRRERSSVAQTVVPTRPAAAPGIATAARNHDACRSSRKAKLYDARSEPESRLT